MGFIPLDLARIFPIQNLLYIYTYIYIYETLLLCSCLSVNLFWVALNSFDPHMSYSHMSFCRLTPMNVHWRSKGMVVGETRGPRALAASSCRVVHMLCIYHDTLLLCSCLSVNLFWVALNSFDPHMSYSHMSFCRLTPL